jgi:tyrosyl-DNA phosphodiesterase 2
MARRGSFPDEPSRRLDRVFTRSPHWRPTAMSLLGTEAVPDTKSEVFPSDHFGVRVVLTRE